MSGKIKDITGNKYGRLTVLGLDHVKKTKSGSNSYWKCECECGNIVVVRKNSLTCGNAKSCGCLQKDIVSKNTFQDITGNKYGRLTVLALDHMQKNKHGSISYWLCKCDCGNECIRSKPVLHEKGKVHSCGCYTIECAKENQKKCAEAWRGKENLSVKTHGDTKSRLYHIYHKAKSRCNNPNDNCYKHYGARGIKFLWNSYEEFKKDMYDSYLDHCEKYGEKNTSIDRIDVNGDYCKENCRWATPRLQANNRSITVYVEMEDNTLYPLSVFSEKCNISLGALRHRYQRSKYNGTKKIPVNVLLSDDEIKLIKDDDIV